MTKKEVKKLYRLKKGKVIAGVCAGIADYFNIDPAIVRIFWILISLFYGAGILAYLIAWVIVPPK